MSPGRAGEAAALIVVSGLPGTGKSAIAGAVGTTSWAAMALTAPYSGSTLW